MKVVIHKVSKIPKNHRTLITLSIYPGNWFLRTFFWFIWKQQTKQFMGFGDTWVEMGSSGFRFGGCDLWYSASGVGSRLCYKSRELAEHAGKNFTEVYKQLMVID